MLILLHQNNGVLISLLVLTIGMKHFKQLVLKTPLLVKSGRRMTAACVWKMCVAKLYVTSRQNSRFLMPREFTIQEAVKFYKRISDGHIAKYNRCTNGILYRRLQLILVQEQQSSVPN